MKKRLYKFLSFILTFILVILSSMTFTLNVFATSGSHGGGGNSNDYLRKNIITDSGHINVEDDGVLGYIVMYLGTQCKAVFSGDFVKYIKNSEVMKKYIVDGTTATPNGDSYDITFSADLVSQFKQALIEYQDEMYGYYIVKTFSLYDLSADFFYSSYEYKTVTNLLNKYGLIGLSAYQWNSVKVVYDLSGYLSHDLAFYQSSSDVKMAICDYNTWTVHSVPGYPLYYDDGKNIIDLDKSYSDFAELYDFWLPHYQVGTMLTDPSSYHTDNLYSWYQFATGYFVDCSRYRPNPYIISKDGSKIMVFKNLTALMNYSVNKRSVFVTPDFDEITGDITGSLEDLAGSIDRMDDILKQFREFLENYGKSDRLNESELEELLQQILDAIKEGNSGNNGGSGSGSGSGSSSWTDSMTKTLFGYLDLIVSYLHGILEGIENLVFFEWNDQEAGDLSDLTDLIKAIKEDPESGSKEAASTLSASFGDIAKALTKKFPFSIPWDLHGLFTVLSGESTPHASPVSMDMVDPYSVQSISINKIDLKEDVHDAPYFELPIVIERYGIDENIIIDLKPFQSVSTLSRTLNSVLFALFLIKFTMRVIPFINGFNGGVDND